MSSESESESEIELATRGPYFFAWANESELFDPVTHSREDDDIFEFDIEHSEGDCPSLRLQVRNPRIGLLAPGRKQWCWFSWWNGEEIVPLFNGRLVGVPDQIQGETVELNFIAKPTDFVAQKIALAETLKVRPYWDSIWFGDANRDDPDNVLESRAALWHVGRVDHTVSISDVLNGEDGTENYTTDEVLYDSVQVTYGQNALRSVTMTANVSWDQVASGGLRRSAIPMTILTPTGQGLAENWPKPGQSIGGGWSFGPNTFCNVQFGPIDPSIIGDGVPFDQFVRTGESHYADGGFDTSLGEFLPGIGWSYHVTIPLWGLSANWDLAYSASRRKQEVLSFTLEADVQPILTDPDDGAALALTMSSSEIAEQIDPGGVAPLSAPNAPAYFSTARGAQSLEYLIAVARANLISRSRAVNVDFEIPFELGVASDLSCRKDAIFEDDRLPGTVVGGKITNYTLSMSGGKQSCSVSIGCAVGRGGAIEVAAGDPTYCMADYVGNDYQFYSGRYDMPFPSDIAYESIDGLPAVDDGLDFNRLTLADVMVPVSDPAPAPGGGPGEVSQEAALNIFSITASPTGQITAVDRKYSRVGFGLKNLQGGPFQTDFAVNVTELKIPKMIDLEAAA